MSQQVKNYLDSLRQGMICLHPAGTLYGLSCDPLSAEAVQRIFDIKKRPSEKSFLYLANDLGTAYKLWKKLPQKWEKALKHVWPNHLTVIWQIKEEMVTKVVHSNQTVGIRVPKYTSNVWFEQVLEQFGFPLPTTSLNYSGEPSLVERVGIEQFCETNDVYIGEQKIICEPNNQLPSTIIKIIDEDKYQLIRHGAFDCVALETFNLEKIN